MTLSSALGNAYSGLAANSRLSELVSRNVANASTEGYAARGVTLGNRVYADAGGGVSVSATQRAGDAFITADRRLTEARAGGEQATADAMRALSELMAPSNGGAGLSQRYTELGSALSALVDSPESVSIQATVLNAAASVARTLQQISAGAASVRLAADADIARQVETVNATLAKIEVLNKEIVAAKARGADATAMEDQRDRQIDTVNRIVPIRVQPRDGGKIALYTAAGGVMLDSAPQPLGFTQTGAISDAMTIDSGALSDVTYAGRAVKDATQGVLRGGSLEAAFRVRDEIVPAFTAQVDALARDLMERFQDPAVDPTLAAGDAGLFVDAGAGGPAFDAVATPDQQVGLASRIEINAAVDPVSGGELRRLRDGLNSATPGLAADATIPIALLDALTGRSIAASPVVPDAPFPAGDPTGFDVPRSAVERVETIASLRELAAYRADDDAAHAGGAFAAQSEAELRITAVDTDKELRDLLAVEKAYAANARVMQVVDDLMQRLLEI